MQAKEICPLAPTLFLRSLAVSFLWSARPHQTCSDAPCHSRAILMKWNDISRYLQAERSIASKRRTHALFLHRGATYVAIQTDSSSRRYHKAQMPPPPNHSQTSAGEKKDDVR